MSGPFDVAAVRAQFPALQQEVHGKPLVYLDNAATSQKPQAVLDAMQHYHERDNANIHRGVHELAIRATQAYEAARDTLARFIHAPDRDEVIYTRGTTEAINLVAHSWGRANLGPGDEVVVSELEHHSNIVPWQLVCEATGARLRVIPIDDQGALDMDAYRALLSDRTKMVAVAHISNALGTVNPVRDIAQAAHAVGALVLLDGAQAVPHQVVDVQELGCDFYCFSGHKMYGPTGIGVLWGRRALLETMPPYQGGGEMIESVSFERTTYNTIPHRFEAGTPHIAGAVGLGAAARWLMDTGIEAIAAHEHDLLDYATERVQEIPGLRIIGTAPGKAAVVSFHLDGIHPHDIGTLMDHEGVAVRTGHHCAQPVMEHFGLPATSRISFAAYNTRDDVDRAVSALRKVQEIFA